MEFVKMHGLGNDFILLDATGKPLPDLPALARSMCDRHFGIGADGLIVVESSDKADLKMRVINADGSEAQMCGNGIRCMAAYARERGLVEENSFKVETLGGTMVPRLIEQNGEVVAVEVNMGPPRLERQDIPMTGPPRQRVVREALTVDGEIFRITALSMGNPHCVIFMDDLPWKGELEALPLAKWGPRIEKHPSFPQGTNVEFVDVRGDGDLAIRVWERGAGITLACGTGACATLVAAHLASLSRRRAKVSLPGGILEIEWREDGNLYMTGPFEKVFEGTYRVRKPARV